MVHPDADVYEEDLTLVLDTVAAGRNVLICINGPGRASSNKISSGATGGERVAGSQAAQGAAGTNGLQGIPQTAQIGEQGSSHLGSGMEGVRVVNMRAPNANSPASQSVKDRALAAVSGYPTDLPAAQVNSGSAKAEYALGSDKAQHTVHTAPPAGAAAGVGSADVGSGRSHAAVAPVNALSTSNASAAVGGVGGKRNVRGGGAGGAGGLEVLHERWQSVIERRCQELGLNSSLVAVMVTEVKDDDADVPSGVHKYRQVGTKL